MPSMSREERVRVYAKSIFKPADDRTEGLEAMVPGSEPLEQCLESIRTSTPGAVDRLDLVAATFERLRTGDPLSPEQQFALEAIIIPNKRPVADILGGRIQALPSGEFSSLVEEAEIRARLEAALASVGCILIPNDPRYPYAGTGFAVGPGLVMTNRHVARLFADGIGTKRLSFVPGQVAQFTPGREVEDAKDDPVFQVRRVVMIHPYWDMALLEIPDLKLAALPLSPVGPSGKRRLVAIVGYPAFDPRNPVDVQNQVFNKRFYVKRLAPGYVTGRRNVQSYESLVSAATHDASSLGGNSGSAVLDVATGHVIGLHFAGSYLDANFAVPAQDLSSDRRVIDAGVTFTTSSPSAACPAAPRWTAIEREEQPPQQPQQPSRQQQLTAPAEGGAIRLTIPIELTLRVGQVVTAAPTADPAKGQG